MLYLSFFLLLSVSVFYFPNNGGSGAVLHFNLLFLVWSGLVIMALAAVSQLRIKRSPAPLLRIGGLLLLLSWLLQAQGHPRVWGCSRHFFPFRQPA